MRLFPNATDRRFLRFCRSGDARALGQVFDATAPELLRVACYLCGNRTDAEDLVQRTFLAAIETRTDYDPQRRAVPWLLGILTNHCKRLRRERQRGSALPEPSGEAASPDPASTAAQHELEATLARLRDELGEPYRDVLRLHLEEGLSAHEIAARLRRPAGTVRTQLVRALARLRERLPDGFVATLVPWLPGPFVGLAAIRGSVLAMAHRLGASAAPAGPGLAFVLAGGTLMSKKIAILVPALVAALGLTGYSIWNTRTARLPPPQPEVAAATVGPLERGPDSLPATRTVGRSAVPRGGTVPEAADPGFAAVRVQVRWAHDKSPAAAVGVFATTGSSVLERDAITDGDGTCTLLHLAPGSWTISTSLSEGRRSVVLVADELRTLDLVAERTAEAQGVVVDETGAEVADASIWVSLDGDGFRGHEVARSDRHGHFVVPLHGAHHLGARKVGFAPSRTIVATPARPDSLRPILRLVHPGGTVRGTVRDARGTAIPWAKVLVGSETVHPIGAFRTGESLPRGNEVVTDADGRFVVPAVPSGLCEVRAWAPGFAPFSGGSDVPARGSAEMPITLIAGALVRGTVKDEHGTPLSDARLRWGAWYQFAHGTTQSAPDGTFALVDLPVGSLEVHAELAGVTAAARLQLVSGVTAAWNPVLGPTRPIAGKVVGPRGEVIVGCQVSAWAADTEKGSAFTDVAGHFEISEVGAEPVTLEVSRAFHTLKKVAGVKPGTRDVVLELAASEVPTAHLRGRIVDTDRRPVRASIVPWREGANRAMYYEADPTSGAFVVGPMPSGRYSLSFESPSHGRQPGGVVELHPEETLDLGDVVLVTPGAAEVQVTIDGHRAPGGLVFFQAADGAWSDTAPIENGRAKARALRPGRHFVTAEFQGLYAACELQVDAGATAHGDLELQRTGRVEVVLDEPTRAKTAQLDATLRAYLHDGSRAGVFGVARLEGTPTFLVDLPPGSYRIAIAAKDGRKAEVAELVVPAPGQTTRIRVAWSESPK